MSLYKAIKHGKEHRRGYRERGKPGEYDVTCRPHGGSNPTQQCPYCLRNRMHAWLRDLQEIPDMPTEKAEPSTATREGREAFFKGEDIWTNPYPLRSEASDDWERGFLEGYEGEDD